MNSKTKLVALSAVTLSVCLSGAYFYFSNKARNNPGKLEPSKYSALSRDERIRLADSARAQGNRFYKEDRLNEAILAYSEAISLYPSDYPDLCYAYSNRAACYLKLVPELYSFNLLFLDRSVSMQPSRTALKVLNIDTVAKFAALSFNDLFLKALDRRSRASEALGKYEAALVGTLSDLFYETLLKIHRCDRPAPFG